MEKQMTNISDRDLLTGIRNKDKQIIHYIYLKLLPVVKRHIVNNSGTEFMAEDIFQDALLILFNKIRADEIYLSSSFSTYFVAICKNLWLNQLRKNRNSTVYFTDEIERFNTIEDAYQPGLDMDFTRLFKKHFRRLSGKSQMVLYLHFNQVTPLEVAKQMGFKNKEYAISRKYKCLKKLISNIKGDPELSSFIFEDERVEIF